MVMWQIVPGAPIGAVIFTHGTPGAFANVGSPTFPMCRSVVRLFKAYFFAGHRAGEIIRSCRLNYKARGTLSPVNPTKHMCTPIRLDLILFLGLFGGSLAIGQVTVETVAGGKIL